MPLHFDPDDNDDHQMKKLDERKASAFLGGAYYRHESWGSLKVAVLAMRWMKAAAWWAKFVLPPNQDGTPDPDALCRCFLQRRKL
jgi:hypothetical protein